MKAIWWLAIATSPWAAATNVMVSNAMRNKMVRANSGTFAAAAARMPGRSGRSGAACAAGAPHHDRAQPDRGPGLGDHRPERGPRHAEPERVDEHQVQRHVGDRREPRREQRRTGVLQPSQRSRRREDDEHGGQPEQADAQVGHGVRMRALGGPQQVDEPGSSDDAHGGQREPDAQPEPDPVDTLGVRASEVTRSRETGHRRGGAMGEEDAEEDRVEQHRRRNAEPGELLGAQVTDDRAVGEQEERFGEEGAERRQGQPQDLPVVPAGFSPGESSGRWSGRSRTMPRSAGAVDGDDLGLGHGLDGERHPLAADAGVLARRRRAWRRSGSPRCR